MKTPVILLLTNDPRLEDTVAEALVRVGALSHLTHCATDALQAVCGVGDALDLAIVDFENGPHGLSLLTAINMCRTDLPMIVITRDDEKHVAALACAYGASACLNKPVTAEVLVAIIRKFCPHQRQLAIAA
jgi:DNA-binding NtrC family response regulator